MALILAGGSSNNLSFVLWTAGNLIVMMGYAAGGWQRILVLKNLLVGYLAISPLLGASLLFLPQSSPFSLLSTTTRTTSTSASLIRLATVGMAMGTAREIVKDLEDVESDRGHKQTLPHVLGERATHRLAYGIVALACIAGLTPRYYRKMLLWGGGAASLPASSPPWLYLASAWIGAVLCVRASQLPLSQGQQSLKKSLYILLAGMISSLLLRTARLSFLAI